MPVRLQQNSLKTELEAGGGDKPSSSIRPLAAERSGLEKRLGSCIKTEPFVRRRKRDREWLGEGHIRLIVVWTPQILQEQTGGQQGESLAKVGSTIREGRFREWLSGKQLLPRGSTVNDRIPMAVGPTFLRRCVAPPHLSTRATCVGWVHKWLC